MRSHRTALAVIAGRLLTRVAFVLRTSGPDKQREFTARQSTRGILETLISRWPVMAEDFSRLKVRDGRGSVISVTCGFTSPAGAGL